MALPSNNISTTLVANTLGTSSRDVGALCTHPAINKWSKYKPVRYDSDGKPLTQQDFKDANYGFLIPNSSSPFSENLEIPWSYLAPLQFDTGFRLGDFREYDHIETEPLKIPTDYLYQEWNKYDSNNPSFNAAVSYKTGGNSMFGPINNRLNVEDLKISNYGTVAFKDLYFSVGIYSGGSIKCVTARAPLIQGTSNGGANIDNSRVQGTAFFEHLKTIPNGSQVTIYPFLNTVNTSYVSGNEIRYDTGRVVNLPNFQPIIFKVVNSFWLDVKVSLIKMETPLYNAIFNSYIGIPAGYSNFSSIKQTVINSNLNTVASFIISADIYDNPEDSSNRRILDVTRMTLDSPLFGGRVDIEAMKIIRSVTYSGSSQTPNSETIDLLVSRTDQITNYAFADTKLDPRNFYNVEFHCSADTSVFRSNALNDDNLPNLARYTVLPRLYYSNTETGLRGIQSDREFRYRFKQP